MNTVTLHYPQKLVFGPGSISQMTKDFLQTGLKRLFILTISPLQERLNSIIAVLVSANITVKIHIYENGEPTFSDYEKIRNQLIDFKADGIAGIGGGSVLDLTKVLAALIKSDDDIKTMVGNGLIKKRGIHLICMPTTSGTGSEVSPNSILMDEIDLSKKGIISPHLVPDATYIDPELTIGLPPHITAYTGIDALTHCIEAYANKYSHPMVNTLALDGINLICNHLKKVYDHGDDLNARTNVALGSVYGGMCLGPVNTAAVHALAYPLGSKYKMAHGLSNAVLLPYVMEYNMSSAMKKHAEIAIASGAEIGSNDEETARNGVILIKKLIKECNIKNRLSDYQIDQNDMDTLAEMAIQVQRLLKNNLKELTMDDIKLIYKSAF